MTCTPGEFRGSERVGFNELLVDPDTTVRRALLFANVGPEEVGYPFALRIALLYLRGEGI